MKAETHIYALRNYTIKQQGNRFYVAATAMAGKHRWSKPYASLQHAATAIARKLQREFVTRHSRSNGHQPSRAQ
jgi:hypothetical protein